MKQDGPLISVIMPVYNTANYLIDTINSVLNQSYKNIELLLIDDGSSDDSYQKSEELARRDSRIRAYQKENGGAGDARNYGLDRALGDYIVFIDSDDIVERDLIENSYRLLVENAADICIYNYDCVNESGAVIDTGEQNPIQEGVFTVDEIFEKTYEKNGYMYSVLWNKLMKRELFDGLRFRKMRMCEDEVLFPRLMIRCQKIVCTKKVLYHYLIRSGSIMHGVFSVKQLDQLRAYYDRADFYYEHNKKSLARIASKEYWENFRIKYIQYDLKKYKSELLDVKKQFNKITARLLTNKLIGFKDKIYILMMRITPSIYKKYISLRSK